RGTEHAQDQARILLASIFKEYPCREIVRPAPLATTDTANDRQFLRLQGTKHEKILHPNHQADSFFVGLGNYNHFQTCPATSQKDLAPAAWRLMYRRYRFKHRCTTSAALFWLVLSSP